MAGFTFEPKNGDGRFHIGRVNIFHDGMEASIVKAVTGVWKEGDRIINRDGSESIRFITSVSNNLEDAININHLLNKRRVVYDKNGHADILYSCEFREELLKFLVEKIGTEEDNPRVLKLSAKEVGDKVVNEFFKDRKIVFKEKKGVFFKSIKDGVEKLEAPFEPILIIGWK